MPTRDTSAQQDAAAGLSGPAYPQQPADAERPVPLRGRPERTEDPATWDSGATEALSAHPPDEGSEERTRRSDEERASQAEGRAHGRAPEVDDESGYSTEQEQGAAQPGPVTFSGPGHG